MNNRKNSVWEIVAFNNSYRWNKKCRSSDMVCDIANTLRTISTFIIFDWIWVILHIEISLYKYINENWPFWATPLECTTGSLTLHEKKIFDATIK